MNFQENVKLAPFTTFNIGGPAKYFCTVNSEADLKEALSFAQANNLKMLFLGGGSNVLISDFGFNGLVVKVDTKGIEKIAEDESIVEYKVGAGENWDNFVEQCVKNNLWGIENLSHIPGLVGGIAVQNVGAYGQEASEVVKTVEVFDTQDNQIKILNNEECRFTYRHSIFNTGHKDRYVILYINFVLQKKPVPNLSYGDVKKYFSEKNILSPSLQEIRNAIIEIRNTKFPFPDSPEKGNAGSFFRGPILNKESFGELVNKVKNNFGEDAAEKLLAMADRLQVPQGYKTPAAFLIQICELKAESVGGARINPTQPAIILNSSGNATATEVMQLFEKVKSEVQKKTGVTLENEPEFIGF